MTRRHCVALFASTLPVAALAQEKKKKEIRFTGRVRMIKKEESTIILRVGSAERQIVFDSNTKFSVLNKAGSLADVKEGGRLICLGTLDEKGRLIATQIDARLN